MGSYGGPRGGAVSYERGARGLVRRRGGLLCRVRASIYRSIHMCKYIHTCISIYIHIYIYINLYVYIYMYISTFLHDSGSGSRGPQASPSPPGRPLVWDSGFSLVWGSGFNLRVGVRASISGLGFGLQHLVWGSDFNHRPGRPLVWGLGFNLGFILYVPVSSFSVQGTLRAREALGVGFRLQFRLHPFCFVFFVFINLKPPKR